MDIKEIALKVVVDTVNKLYDSTASYSELTEEDKKFYWTFAEALIAEIAKQNEPVESQYKGSDGSWKSFDSKDHESNTRNSGDWEVRDLFAFPPTAEQIANETAEACAKYIDSTNGNIRGVNTVFSKALRSGAWKEFKK